MIAVPVVLALVLGLAGAQLVRRRSSSRGPAPTVAGADKRGPAALGYGYDTSTPETDPSVLGIAGASLASTYQAAALAAIADPAGTIDFADPNGNGAL